MSYLESDRLAAIEFLEQHSLELVDWPGRDSHITLAEFIHQRRGEQMDRLERKLDVIWWHMNGHLTPDKVLAYTSEAAAAEAEKHKWPGGAT